MFAVCLPLVCDHLESCIFIPVLCKGAFVVYEFMAVKIPAILLQLLLLLVYHNFLSAGMFSLGVVVDCNYTMKIICLI